MQDMNNTPNTEQNRSSAPADEWKELLETPEVMSSSGSPSSRDIPAPADYPWEVESSSAPSSSSSKIGLTWEHASYQYPSGSGDSTTSELEPKPEYEIYLDTPTNTWRIRLTKVTCGCQITLPVSFRDAATNPPTTEEEAIEAVNDMNGYQARGQCGDWHTLAATTFHEEHHKREWEDACNFYFEYNGTQEQIENLSVSKDDIPAESSAERYLTTWAYDYIQLFHQNAKTYWFKLPDTANSRPYCAGQKELNKTTQVIINNAGAKGWEGVPDSVTAPGIIEPPCFLPPVNQKGGSSAPQAAALDEMPVQLSLCNMENLKERSISLVFSNTGVEPVRILDTFTLQRLPFFVSVFLKDSSGKKMMRCERRGKITLAKPLIYKTLSCGNEYKVQLPLDSMIPAGIWDSIPSGSYTLTVIYQNQYGEDCLKGDLSTSCEVVIE